MKHGQFTEFLSGHVFHFMRQHHASPCFLLFLPILDHISLFRHPQDLTRPSRRYCPDTKMPFVPQSQSQYHMIERDLFGPAYPVTVSLPNFCPVRSLQSRRNMHTPLAAVGEFASFY
jgi:hypothetical protein